MLVGGLRQAGLPALLAHGLAVGHHGVRDDEVALGVLVPQILQFHRTNVVSCLGFLTNNNGHMSSCLFIFICFF